jgi:putative peptide zinc metalloprotease protein
VDAAGIFMSLLCASSYATAFLLTGRPVFGILALLCDITVLFNLNPFVRMDGYWLISDWLGIQNLMSVNKEVTWWLARRAMGHTIARPAILSEAYAFRPFFLIYYCLFILFFAYLTLRTVIHYLPALLTAYPTICAHLLDAASHRSNSGEILRDFLSWLLATVTLLGVGLLLLRLVRRSAQWAFPRISKRSALIN